MFFSKDCFFRKVIFLLFCILVATVSKEDMEKLRQALRILSEAEKQLRVTTDKVTWLTAALLQLAPDQNYLLFTSSGATPSKNHTPTCENMHEGVMLENHGRDNALPFGRRNEENVPSTSNYGARSRLDNSQIWQEVLDNVQSASLRKFLIQEAKLNSVTLGEGNLVNSLVLIALFLFSIFFSIIFLTMLSTNPNGLPSIFIKNNLTCPDSDCLFIFLFASLQLLLYS
jgi:hypothetical protein